MVIRKKDLQLFLAFICIGIAVGSFMKINIDKTSKTAFSFNDTITVVCDAGHGSPDGGAVGRNGTLEKDVNLAITLKLQEVLESSGIKVVMTRTEDSGLHDGEGSIRDMKVMDMNNRLDIIKNSNADLFVSIHMNSFTSNSPSGVHVFYDEKHEDIKALATNIQDSVTEQTDAKSHDIKIADNSLFLLKNTPIPAVLVECGFLSNEDEEKKLNSEEYQSKIAWSIGKAIIEYYKK